MGHAPGSRGREAGCVVVVFWSIMQLTFLCTQMRVNASKIEAKRLGLHDRSFENGTLSDPPFLP